MEPGRHSGGHAVKSMLLDESSNVCLSIVSHLVQSCLTQTSEHLSESTEELIEDLRVGSSRGQRGTASGAGKGDEVLNAEESFFVGTVLHDIQRTVAGWFNGSIRSPFSC